MKYRSKRVGLMVEACLNGTITCDEYGNIYKNEYACSETVDFEGYRTICIKGVGIPSHQVIAFIKFGGKAIKEGIVTRHLNGIKSDNTWNNIAIGTPKDNRLDIPAETRSQIRKDYWASLTPEQRSIRNKKIAKKISPEVQRARGLKGGKSCWENRLGMFKDIPK